MGSGFSVARGNPRADEVKTLLNTILREMFQRADMVDLYSLADPARCSKYVVVGATALKRLFVSINLEPKLGTDGIVYFQKIEGIQKANPMGNDQIKMCKYLAFYFIRIFQIYAALTLSVMDSALPQEDPSKLDVVPQRNRRGVQVLAPENIKGFSPGSKKWWGGALSSTAPGNFYLDINRAGTYKLLNQVLLAPVDPAGSMRFQENNDITIAQADLYDNPGLPDKVVKNFSDRTTERPIVLYSFSSGSNYRNISGRIFLENAHDGIDIILKDIKIADKDTIIDEIKEKLSNRRPGDENPVSSKGKNITGVLQDLFLKVKDKIEPPVFSVVTFLKKYNIIGSGEGAVRIEGTNISIPYVRDVTGNRTPIQYKSNFKVYDKSVPITINAGLVIEKQAKMVLKPQEYIIKVDLQGVTTKPEDLKALLDLKKERWRKFSTGEANNSAPLSDKGESIAAYLESVFKKLLSNEDERRGDIVYNAQGRPKPFNVKGEEEELKVKRLWDALVKNPPAKAHCVARAVQLLNVAAIKGIDGEAYSSVCRIKFPYITHGALPEPGKDILTSDGVYSLAMLFIDRLMGEQSVPKISNTAKFQEFRTQLKFSFERFKTIEETPAPPSLGEVKDKMMPFCEGHTEDKILLKGGIVGRLRAKVNSLMNRQANHIGRVMVIIFKLFDERAVRAGTVAMNPAIMAGGMDAVNKIAEESRDLLIEYYSDCEKTYKEGLFEIYNQGKDAIQFGRVD